MGDTAGCHAWQGAMFDEKQHCLCHLGSMLAYLYFQILIFDLGVQRLV